MTLKGETGQGERKRGETPEEPYPRGRRTGRRFSITTPTPQPRLSIVQRSKLKKTSRSGFPNNGKRIEDGWKFHSAMEYFLLLRALAVISRDAFYDPLQWLAAWWFLNIRHVRALSTNYKINASSDKNM